MKSALMERSFCDATDILNNTMERVKRLSQNGFQECFQHLYRRWQKCIAAQGDNFVGKIASIIILFCIS